MLGLPWLVAPWWLGDRLSHPQAWWWEAGLADAGVGALSPGVAELALGQPGGPGGPVAVGWLGAGVLVAGGLALLRGDTRAVVGTAWCVGASGLALAALGAGRILDLAGEQVPTWVGFGLVVWWGGLLTAAAVAAGGLTESLPAIGRGRPWVVPVLASAVVVAALCPLVALAVQAAAGIEGPLHRSPAVPLPTYLSDDARTGAHVSTLLLAGTTATGLSLTIEREDGWRLGEEAFIGAAGAAPVTAAVRDLLVSPQTRSVDTLARWGIGYLYAVDPVDPVVGSALDSAPGLVRSGAPSGDGAWRLQVEPRQLQLARASGRAGTVPPPGVGDSRQWWVAAQLTCLGLALVLAAPGRYRRPT